MPVVSFETFWSASYLAGSYCDPDYWGLTASVTIGGIYWHSGYTPATYYGPDYWALTVELSRGQNFIDPDELMLIAI